MFEKGKTYNNRTRSYLSNIIDSVSPSWIKEYICEAKRTAGGGWKLCNTVGFFRNDLEFEDTFPDLHKHLMFILVDINGEWDDVKNKYKNIYLGREKFQKFTREFRKKKSFHWDYPFDDPFKGYLHCFVFDMEQYGVPVKDWSKALDKFDEGKYSQIFTKEELSKLTGVNKTGNIWKTLIGDTDKSVLKKRIEEQFGTILMDKDVEGHTELDIKPIQRFEVLNFDKFNLK